MAFLYQSATATGLAELNANSPLEKFVDLNTLNESKSSDDLILLPTDEQSGELP